jgi:hypothetical protein
MLGPGRYAASLSTILLAATVALGAAGPAAAVGGTTRYASPHGTGAVCSRAVPCAIDEAIDNAGAGSTVLVEPGRYGSTTHPVASTLTNAEAISVRGTSRSSRPVIYTSAQGGIDLSGGGKLENVILHDVSQQPDPVGIHVVDGYVAHVTVVTHEPFANACSDPRVVLDSACISTGKSGIAIIIDGSTAVSTETFSGVTAEAPGPNGTGVDAVADVGSLALSVFNSIVHGTTDVKVGAFPGLTASVTLNHSDFATTTPLGFGGTETLVPGVGDIKKAPRFVNAAADNFAEAAGSPTINAGGETTRSTTTDVAGNPRVLGAAPDMGAYEFLQAPTVRRLTVTKRAHHFLRVAVRVNPQGLPAHLVVVAHLRKHHVRSSVVATGNGRRPRTLHVSLPGLRPGRTYTVRAVVTNKAGMATSAARTISTKT